MDKLFEYRNGSHSLGFLLLTLLIGIIAACCGMLWQIQVPGALVRALSAKKAYGENNAVGARELGYKKEWLLRFLLSRDGALSKYVGIIGEEKDGKGRLLLLSSALYLKEETKERAELRYRKKNASVGALIAAIILFSILAVALSFIIPDLLKMLENFINTLKVQE